MPEGEHNVLVHLDSNTIIMIRMALPTKITSEPRCKPALVDFILDATLEAFEFLTKLALPRSALEDQLDRGKAFHIEQQQSEQKSSLVGGSHDCLY